MSKQNEKDELNKSGSESNRSQSPNPFSISLSPRSDGERSPRSPRFEQIANGMRMQAPQNGAAINPLTAASPPRFATIEQFMDAANKVQNMALAHEISVNQNFKLEKLDYDSNSLEKQIQETVHKAFWDALKDDFNKIPPDYKHTYILIQEAKLNLMSLLLPNHNKLKETIEHVLDMDLIKQQMEANTFEYQQYALFICDMMSKLCAPIRDEEILKIRALKDDPIEMFKHIMQTLEVLKLDMANFTISQMRPYIQQQVVAYEQKKFKEFLDIQKETGVDGLEFTKQWLLRAHQRISENKTIGRYVYESGITASSVTNEAFMEIFVWKGENLFPETMAMDEIRFNEVYVKCRKYLVVCTIINTIYTLLGETLYGYQELKLKLKQNILILLDDYLKLSFEEMMTNIGEEVIKLTNEALVKLSRPVLNESQQKSIKSLVVDLSSKDLHENTVFRLLFCRYIEFLHGIFTKRNSQPVKLPQGTGSVEKELLEVTGQFLRLVTFNKTVFGSYYGEIIENINKNASE